MPNATTYLPDGLPAPLAGELDGPFWEGTKAHELRMQRCADCSAYQFPPEVVCRACGGAVVWQPVSGRGVIASWMRIWHPTHPVLVSRVPYRVVIVSLEEDEEIRLFGGLLSGSDLDDPVIGSPVTAVFEDHGDDYTLVQWRAAPASR